MKIRNHASGRHLTQFTPPPHPLFEQTLSRNFPLLTTNYDEDRTFVSSNYLYSVLVLLYSRVF